MMTDVPTRPTYDGWKRAREHSWECNCGLCRVNLDNIDPETLGRFKARHRSEDQKNGE